VKRRQSLKTLTRQLNSLMNGKSVVQGV